MTWRFKSLWLFGLLASWGFLGGGSELNLFWRARNWVGNPVTAFPTWQGFWQSDFWRWSRLVNFLKLAWLEPISFIKLLFIFLLLLLIVLLFIWLAVIAQAGLVRSAADFSQKGAVSLRDSFILGRRKFWPILGLNLIVKLLTIFVFVLLLLPFWTELFGGHYVFSLIFSLFSFLVLLPLLMLVSLMIRYAIQFMVLENKDLRPAWGASRRLLARNLWSSVEMMLALALLYFLAALALVLVFLFLGAPFIVMAVGSFLVRSPALFWSGLISTGLVAVLVILWGGAVFTAWQWSAWTLFFERITNESVPSKLTRVIDRILKKK